MEKWPQGCSKENMSTSVGASLYQCAVQASFYCIWVVLLLAESENVQSVFVSAGGRVLK